MVEDMFFDSVPKYLAVVAIAALVTLLATPLVARLGIRIGMIDQPGARRLHRTPVPRCGGLAVFLGVHAGLLLTMWYPWQLSFDGTLTHRWWVAFVSSSLIVLAVGIYDDARGCRWYTKLAGQCLAACVLFALGVRFDRLLGIELPFLLDLSLTLLWCTALMNAFNLIDGADGLATGLAAIAALGLAGASAFRHVPADTMAFLALAASCIAFLRHNFHPARIFLGDNGSMFLGFTLACLTLQSSTKGTVVATIGMPILAVGVPVFDAVLAVWRRSARAAMSGGRLAQVMQADMEHLHHRLLRAGLTQRAVALWLYAANALLVLLALASLVHHSHAAGMFVIAFVLGSYAVVRHLATMELWHSGSAILAGLRRPPRPLLCAVLYPVADFVLLSAALLATEALLPHDPSNTTSPKLAWFSAIPLWCGVTFLAILTARTYRRVWSRARVSDFVALTSALWAGALLCAGVSMVLAPNEPLVLQRAATFALFATVLLTALRAFPRVVEDLMALSVREGGVPLRRVLVYGASHEGIMYVRHRTRHRDAEQQSIRVIGFLDDTPALRGRLVHGLPVLGDKREVPQLVAQHSLDEIIVATPLSAEVLNSIVTQCREAGIAVRSLVLEERTIEPAPAPRTAALPRAAQG